MRVIHPRLHLVFVLLVLAVILGLPWAAAAADDKQVPEEVRSALEEVLHQKVVSLLNEKDEAGRTYKRGSYSHSFHKVDDSTYQVTFHEQTAGKDTLVTQRYLLTLKKDASGAWTIAKENLEDTFAGMVRRVPGSETFGRFSSMSLKREGMTITASGGILARFFTRGTPDRLVVTAADLSYRYDPPKDACGMYGAVLEHYRKKYRSDLEFEPEYLSISCTPKECEEILSTAFTDLKPVSLEQTDAQAQKEYREYRDDWDKALQKSYFAGFHLPPNADRVFWSLVLKKKGMKHNVRLVYDNYEPKEVSYWVDRLGGTELVVQFGKVRFPLGPILRYYSAETVAGGTDPAALERRDDAESRFYELEGLKGTVEMALGDAELLKGDITYRINAKRDLDRIGFRISRVRPIGQEMSELKNPKMTINSIQDGEGHDLTWVRTGAASGLVLLSQKVPAGSPITLRLQFENRDSIYKLTPSFSYVDRGGWLPFVRFGDMIDKFDLTIKVPSRYQVLGIGGKVSETVEGDVRVTRWKPESPVEFPTVIFGDYIDDHSKIEVKKSDGTIVPVNIHVDKVALQDWGIAPKSLRALADEAANAINLYQAVYGVDYPYSKLDLVNDAFGGFYGQAPSSLIYIGSPAFRGRGLLGVVGGSYLAQFARTLVAHETGHQWWGSVVANANTGNYWFVESLAEYSSALFDENVYGRKRYLDHVAQWRRFILDNEMLSSVQDASTLATPGYGDYQAAVYMKGPYAFHMLREIFGDEAFFKFLRNLAQELKGKEIVTRDMQRVAEESFGGKMDFFFDEWIRGVGIPQYAFHYDVRQTEDRKYLVKGTIRQRVVAGLDKFEMKGVQFRAVVPITVVFGKNREAKVKVLVEKAETPFAFKVPERPVEVVLDKYGESLADDVLVNRDW